jgi:N-acetylneuraminate lyase
MESKPLEGLVAATFAPFAADSSLDVSVVGALVDHLVAEGVTGLFVSGTTGEGESLTLDERRVIATAYVDAASGRVPVVVQVGRQSLLEGRGLAEHAASIGASGISAAAPAFFKPRDEATLAASMAVVAAGAPTLPFYYYHIPRMTGAPPDMIAFLRAAESIIPNLRGIKFSDVDVLGFQACVSDPRYDVLWGVDEMLLTGLTHGARGAIGSTYNFAAPLYRRILDAHDKGDLATAQAEQRRAVAMVDVLIRHGALPAFKALMRLLGFDCGGTRLPNTALDEAQTERLRADLDGIGFFDSSAGVSRRTTNRP